MGLTIFTVVSNQGWAAKPGGMPWIHEKPSGFAKLTDSLRTGSYGHRNDGYIIMVNDG